MSRDRDKLTLPEVIEDVKPDLDKICKHKHTPRQKRLILHLASPYKKGATQQSLASDMGIRPETLSRYKTPELLEDVVRVANFCLNEVGLRIDYVLTGRALSGHLPSIRLWMERFDKMPKPTAEVSLAQQIDQMTINVFAPSGEPVEGIKIDGEE